MKMYDKWLVVRIKDGKECIVTSDNARYKLITLLDEYFGTNKAIPYSDYKRVGYTQWRSDEAGIEFRVVKNTKEYKI